MAALRASPGLAARDHRCCSDSENGVGRTGFGNVDQSASDAGTLRPATVSDENAANNRHKLAVDCAVLLATCVQESTGANPVVAALARAALEWVVGPDVKRLRSALLKIIADLD